MPGTAAYHGPVLIWLNGTFGAGKTMTADELLPLVPGSRLFDPEYVGYLLKHQLADRPAGDFQDWPAWRALVVANAAELARLTGEHLVIPQTVLSLGYLDEIFSGLRAAQLPVFHVLLDADDGVLRGRIEASEEARQWRLDHLAPYRAVRQELAAAADLVLDTAALAPAQAAARIAAALPGPADIAGPPAAGSSQSAATAAAPPASAGPSRSPQLYRNGVLAIVVDCADLDRSARFWTEALGYTAGPAGDRYRPLFPADGAGIEVLLQRAAGDRRHKNRVHLDLRTGDLAAETERICALGATRLTARPVTEDGWRWHILADPDGNEFCVLQPPHGPGG